MEPIVVGVLQWLTALGIHAAFWPCNCCTCNVWSCTVEPFVIGYGVTALGDVLGPARTAAIYPIIGAYLSGVVGFGAGVAIFYAFNALRTGTAALAPGDFLNQASDPYFALQQATSFAAAVAVSAIVPVTYWVFAVPKEPDDTSVAFPSFFPPARAEPLPTPPAASRRTSPRERVAMAY
jgi:hypothetical protein